MTQDALLNAEQLMAIMRNSPLLERIAEAIPDWRDRLIDIEKRSGDAHAAGDWVVEATGEKYSVAQRSPHPTVSEAQKVFGGIYLALENDALRSQLKAMMDEIGLTLSVRRKGWGDQMADGVKGFF